MLASFGGGSTGLLLCYIKYGHTIPVGRMVNCVMGSLVSYTAITFLCNSVEAVAIGSSQPSVSHSNTVCNVSSCVVHKNTLLSWWFWLTWTTLN